MQTDLGLVGAVHTVVGPRPSGVHAGSAGGALDGDVDRPAKAGVHRERLDKVERLELDTLTRRRPCRNNGLCEVESMDVVCDDLDGVHVVRTSKTATA